MLVCCPRGIHSWDFDITGTRSGPATMTYASGGDDGVIEFQAIRYEIARLGVASQRWTLECHGQVIAEATRVSVSHRRYDMKSDGRVVVVQGESLFGRGFEFVIEGRPVGVIRPMRFWGRKAQIECTGEVSEVEQLFAFFLVAPSWVRAGRKR